MRNRAGVLLIAFCTLLASAAGAHGGTELRVLDTHPSANRVTLDKNQAYYVRIGYSTDEPVRIWARPFYRGEEVPATSNASAEHSGSGEALGWFALHEPGERVDEVRISAQGRGASGVRLVESLPVNISVSVGRGASTSEPDWVSRLREENQRLLREAYQERSSAPLSAGESLFAAGFMLAVLALGIGGIVAPLRAWRRWRGGWRTAAAVPVALIGFVILRIVFGVMFDPTSHNLWPFEILQVGVLSLAIIGVLVVARKFAGVRN